MNRKPAAGKKKRAASAPAPSRWQRLQAAARQPRTWLLIACLVFSGGFQVMMSAPANWWFLTPVYLIPGFWALSQLEGKQAFWGGWLMGFSANVVIFTWLIYTIQVFSNLPTFAAVMLLGLFGLAFGLYAAFFAWGLGPIRRASGQWWPLAAAAWWVTCEFINPQLFPYYQGVIFYQVPEVFLITTLTGVPGVSFQIVLWNGLAVWALHRWRRGESLKHRPLLKNLAVTGALLLFTLVVSQLHLAKIEEAEAQAPSRTIGLIQTNLDVHARAELYRQSPTAILDVFLRMCREALAKNPNIDAFVWPEGALPGTPYQARNRALLEFVKETGVEIWTGGDHAERVDGQVRQYNAAYRVHGEGQVDQRYDKNILLPFGEFMPLKDVFPILRRIQGVGNFMPGDGLTVYDTPHGRFCFLICYEAIRHGYVRTGVQREVDLLVNITYDAWFGDTNCPAQHLMLSAIQSAQYGVPLVRAATTGISAFVDARGILTQQTDVFKPAVLVGEVKQVRVPTVYGAVGDVFAWACVIATFALLIWGLRQKRQRS